MEELDLMGLTPKQERNGIPEMLPGHVTAEPGPMAAPPVAAATAAVVPIQQEAHGLWTTPAGAGAQDIGPTGPMFEWDSGLAINDVEGGGSS
jgi:hypothetical protein